MTIDIPQFKSLWKQTLDIFYPPTCVSCESHDDWWCADCQTKAEQFTKSLCRNCGEQNDEGHSCPKALPFYSLTACGPYGSPALRKLITSLKYRSATCLKPDLTTWLKTFREGFTEPWPWAKHERFLVTHIPGDPARLRERGYDHSEDLARLVCETFIPWTKAEALLKRVKSTTPNAQLPADLLRAANVNGAFQAIRPIQDPVLLVDDVFTTGATTIEATKALLKAGASEVHVFVLAKGGRATES